MAPHHVAPMSGEYNGGALVGTAVAFLALSWISVLLRTYVRVVMLKGFMLDDWFMLSAQTVFTGSCALVLRGCHHGLGMHNGALARASEIQALMYQALATASYILNMTLIKLSIGVFLLRLATATRYRWAIWASIVVVAVWSAVLLAWNVLQCRPLAAQWDYTILQRDPAARCVSAAEVVKAAYALSVMTVLTDCFYALVPIPLIWRVDMSIQAKVTVSLVLGLGVFASIATLVRLKFLARLTDTSDILFAGTDAMVWTLIEPGIAIVAASLVTIRPLLRACRIKGFRSIDNSNFLQTGPGHANGPCPVPVLPHVELGRRYQYHHHLPPPALPGGQGRHGSLPASDPDLDPSRSTQSTPAPLLYGTSTAAGVVAVGGTRGHRPDGGGEGNGQTRRPGIRSDGKSDREGEGEGEGEGRGGRRTAERVRGLRGPGVGGLVGLGPGGGECRRDEARGAGRGSPGDDERLGARSDAFPSWGNTLSGTAA